MLCLTLLSATTPRPARRITIVTSLHPRRRGCAGREIGEVGLSPRQPVDRVEQHLGLQAARVVARVILPIDEVVCVRDFAQLIGSRLRDDSDEILQIKAAGNKMFFESFQQSGIRRRVRVANVVFRLDQPAHEEVFPIPIDELLREERVALRTHPIGELESRVFIGGDLWNRITQRGGFDGHSRLQVRGGRDPAFVEDQILAASS